MLLQPLILFAQDKFYTGYDKPLNTREYNTALSAENPIDVLHYDIALQIYPDNKTITGLTILQIVKKTTENTDFYLDFYQLNIDSIFVENQKTTFHYDKQQIEIPFGAARDTFFVRIYYRGSPGNDGTGGFFFTDRIIFTVGEGLRTYPPSKLRYWSPSHDVPDDKALLDIRITVPEPLQAFSNGLLVSTEKDRINHTATYHWRESHPIAPYLIAIAVSDYEVLSKNYVSVTGDTIPLEFYVTPEKKEKALEDWKDLPLMMKFFEENFYPYPFDRYSMAEVYIGGAMEHQTMTSYSSGLITGDHRFDYIIVHELAHHWFGDLVTLSDWREIWLNEGFATYCEALYFEWTGDQTVLQNYMTKLASEYFSDVGSSGHFPIYDPVYLWGSTVYEKGGWVLHMLRRAIGENNFWEMMRQYIHEFAYGNSTIDDFKRIAEQVSGQDLDWFFTQWIYNSGFPELNVGWEMSKLQTDEYKILLTIEQKQKTEKFYHLPVEILFKSETAQKLDTVIVNRPVQSFDFTLQDKPDELVMDPDTWLLKKVNIIARPLPPGFVENEFNISQNYPNPFIPGNHSAETYFNLQVAKKNAPHHVSLCLFNVLGEKVKTLLDKKMISGLYTFSWDGTDDNGIPVPSGLYFVRFKSNDVEIIKKLTLLKHE
ncbi:hypothetical protein JXQ31_06320 [candidate division KSB1 bacterium]|nr:hypothetical protein [candidate division KSB1 bacterium]